MKEINILFVCSEFPPMPHGGIGIFVKNLTKRLTDQGFRCVVVGIYPVAKKSIETIDGVEIVRLPETNLAFLNSFKLFRIIKEVINRFKLSYYIKNLEQEAKLDIIESYEWNGPLAFKPKTKLLVRLHGSNTAYSVYEGKSFSRFLRFHESRNLGFADHIVSVSDHLFSLTQETFSKIHIPKCVIYNSYNSIIFSDLGDYQRNSNKILFVGKFHERKGVFELFKILNVLLGLNLNYEFEFVGPYRSLDYNEIITFINPDFRSRIKFIGPLTQGELSKRYQECSIMIMPSRAEAFGLTAIEAMACGCVVAMSNLPIAGEIIDDNINGIIINPMQIQETAEKIHMLLLNKSLIERIRKNAVIKTNAKFSSEEILKQNICMYKEMLK